MSAEVDRLDLGIDCTQISVGPLQLRPGGKFAAGPYTMYLWCRRSRRKVMTPVGLFRVGCAILIFGFGSAVLAADRAPESGQGVWQKHEYNFQFLGFTTTYSCDGLANKLKVLMIAAGARADAKSTSGGCSRGYGVPDKFA